MSLNARIGADFSQLQKALADMQREMKDQNTELAKVAKAATDAISKIEAAGKSSADSLQKTGKELSSLGATLTVGVTAPLVAAGVASTKFASQFDADMTKIVTLAGVAEEDLGGMRAAVLALAPETGQGPDALAKALLVVTSTGFEGKEALDVLEVSAKASAAGLGETAVVAKAVTAVITAYGAENITAAKAADQLFATAKLGAAEAAELAPQLGRVVGAANELGISFAQVGGFIATYTRLGLDASEATTALSGVMSALQAPSKETNDALQSLGTSAQEVRDKIKKDGLAAALLELKERAGDNTEALANVFGNVRALAGVLGTTGAQAKDFAANEKEIAEATGDVNRAFERTKETTQFKFAQLAAEAESVAIAMGDELAPALKSALDAAKPLAEALIGLIKVFGDLPQPVQTAIIGLVGFAAAAGPIVGITGKVVEGVGALSSGKALGGLGSILTRVGTSAGSLSPLLAGIGTAAIAGVAGGIALSVFMSELDKTLNNMQATFDRMKRSKPELIDPQQQAVVDRTTGALKSYVDMAQALGLQAEVTGQSTAGLTLKFGDAAMAGLGVSKSVETVAKVLPTLTDQIRAAQREVANLTAAQRANILAGDAMGLSNKEITDALNKQWPALKLTEQAVKLYLDQVTKSKKAHEEWNKELEKLAKALETSSEGLEAMLGKMRPLEADLTAIAKAMGVGIDRARGLSDALKDIKAPEIGIYKDPFGNLAKGGSQAVRLLGEVEEKARSLDDQLRDLSNAFRTLGDAIGGSTGAVLSDLGNIVDAVGKADQAGKQFAKGYEQGLAGIADMAAGVMNGISAIAQATSSASRGMNIAGGAVTGAKLGAQIGTAIMPGIGTAIGAGAGAIAGALVGALRGKGMREELGRVGKEWGVTITSELAKAINDSAKALGGNRQLAELLSFDKILKEAGGLNEVNFEGFLKKFRDIFSMLETGKVTTKQATEFIEKNFSTFADALVASGDIASDAFVEILSLNQRFGTESPAILDFIAGQTARVGAGVADLAGPLTTQFGGLAEKIDAAKGKVTDAAKALGGITDLDAAKVKLQELAAAAAKAKGTGDEGKATAALEAYQKALLEATKAQGELNKLLQDQAAGAETAAAELEDLGVIALGSFNAAVAGGLDWAAAMDKVGPGLDALIALQKDLGTESSNFAVQQLIDLRELVTKNKDLVKAAGALDDTLLALSNTGALNVDTLEAMERTGERTFDRLKKAGFDDNQIYSMMKDYLEDVEAAHLKLGTPIDANTQKMIDQAREAGILKDKQKSATEIMEAGFRGLTDAINALATAIGKGLPDAIGKVPKTIPIDVKFNVPDLELPTGTIDVGVPGYASGTRGRYVNFGAGTLAMLHGREKITPAGEDTGGGGPSIYIDARGALLGDLASQQQLVALVDRAYAGALAGRRVGIGV